jgi:dsDNA-specific endonuclease/ATPase MutS2
MKFHLNEKVAFLREKGYAVIKSISNNTITVLDDDGFERRVQDTELVKIIVDDFQVEVNLFQFSEKDQSKKHGEPKVLKSKNKHSVKVDLWEIDLHIDKLPDEILNTPSLHYIELQMKALRHFLEKVKTNRINHFTIIHGVGDGILKSEVLNYLSKFEHFKISTADHLKYGNGATKVNVDNSYFSPY